MEKHASVHWEGAGKTGSRGSAIIEGRSHLRLHDHLADQNQKRRGEGEDEVSCE